LTLAQRLTITDFTTCRVRHHSLPVGNVTHYVIKSRVNDAAMDGIFPAKVILVRCEFGRTDITINMKGNVEAYRVVFAAGKAHTR